MEAFFADLLDGFLEADFLKMVHRKFHYGEEQYEALMTVAGEMLPIIRREAFWERGAAHSCEEDAGVVYEEVVMSLGKGLDDLQEEYGRKGMLLESYMLETLADELLMKGYGAYNRHVSTKGEWHVARYHFLGSEERFPLEMLPNLLKKMGNGIRCNSSFYMEPKKSVAFVAELTRDQTLQCEGICIGCSDRNCPNRVEKNSHRKYSERLTADIPLSYGYSRILGRL